MFASSLVWLFIGFCVTGAQLNKRMLIPSGVCKKQPGASLNEQVSLRILTAVLNYTRRGESKVTSWKGEREKNSCVINKSCW